MPSASPATYGLLGMLATRSWTGYELTQQVRRSLRFVWPTSEGHLYREQKRLVTLGWAAVTTEPAGRRTRQRYTITAAGRRALRTWLASETEEPHFQVEGILRSFYADSAGPAELAASMRTTAASAQEMLEGNVTRGAFHGRPMHPDRLHSVALALDVTTQLLQTVAEFFTMAAAVVAEWPSTTDQSLTPETRRRLQRVQARDAARDPGQGGNASRRIMPLTY